MNTLSQALNGMTVFVTLWIIDIINQLISLNVNKTTCPTILVNQQLFRRQTNFDFIVLRTIAFHNRQLSYEYIFFVYFAANTRRSTRRTCPSSATSPTTLTPRSRSFAWNISSSMCSRSSARHLPDTSSQTISQSSPVFQVFEIGLVFLTSN